MRRASRLFELVQLIRSRRLSTAQWLAERLEISERTVYRDISALQRQGVPIEGAAGVGYRMRAGFDLPPLMFSIAEAQAIAAAVRLMQPRIHAELAQAGQAALGKIMTALPVSQRVAVERLALFAPMVYTDSSQQAVHARLEFILKAIEVKRKLSFEYLDAQNCLSQRIVRPLGCMCWPAVWTLAAWCEMRGAFRNFRLDRMRGLHLLPDVFRDEADKTLADLLRLYQPPE